VRRGRTKEEGEEIKGKEFIGVEVVGLREGSRRMESSDEGVKDEDRGTPRSHNSFQEFHYK